MTLILDTSPKRTSKRKPVESHARMFPMIGARVDPPLYDRLAVAAKARGLSKGEYAARLLAAAQDALDAQEAPLQSTG